MMLDIVHPEDTAKLQKDRSSAKNRQPVNLPDSRF